MLLFMTKEDEAALLRFIEHLKLEVYPRRVPPDWQPFLAKLSEHDRLPEEDIYLVASQIGPALVDKVKRGPDKGFWRVDETRSPVIFWNRCLKNDDGELLSGQMWAETDVNSNTGRRAAPDEKFRQLFVSIEEHMRKLFRKGDPKPYLVGPNCAREVKESNLKLRENEHLGRLIAVHR